MTKSPIDPRRMSRKFCVQFLGVHHDTFDTWISQGAPVVEVRSKGKPALYSLPNIIKWRHEKDIKSVKPPEKEKVDIEPVTLFPEDLDPLEFERYRKLKIENDENAGLFISKSEMEDKYFTLGRNLRDSLMAKPVLWGPQLDMITGFDATNYLRKELERLCNSFSDLKESEKEKVKPKKVKVKKEVKKKSKKNKKKESEGNNES